MSRRKHDVPQERLEYLKAKEYWTQLDVADYFGVGMDQVRTWRKQGLQFTVELSGRGMRIKQSKAIAWYDAREMVANNHTSGAVAVIYDNKPRRKAVPV